jgi:hypothetical protein
MYLFCLQADEIVWRFRSQPPGSLTKSVRFATPVQFAAKRCGPLDSLDPHAGSVGRQRLQVVRIGREYGPSGFRECHDKRIDGGPTTSQSPQQGCSPRKRLRDCIGDVTGLEEPILVRIAPRVPLQALHENHGRYRRWPEALLAQGDYQG